MKNWILIFLFCKMLKIMTIKKYVYSMSKNVYYYLVVNIGLFIRK